MSKQPRKTNRKSAIAKRIANSISKSITKKSKKKTLTGQKSSLGKSLLTGAGRALGSLVGLGELGASAGSAFSHLLGMGAYKINSNSIMNDSTQAPVFDNSDKSITISHSELVTDVVGSVAYTSRAFMIDPTNLATFPYLAGIATNFEQYEFKGLVFTYKPTSGSAIASTNNSLGTVILTTEYDVSRQLFQSKADMEAYEFSTSVEPCSMMYHPVECNPKLDILNSRYVTGPIRSQRSSTYTSGSNISGVQNNLQFLGRTQLATVGMQAATTVGELWVTYKIKLFIPRKPGQSNFQGMFHACNNVALPIGSATALGTSYNVINDSTSSLANVDLTVVGTGTQINVTGLPPGTSIIVNLFLSSTGTINQPIFTSTNLNTFGEFITNGATGSTNVFTPAGTTQQYLGAAFSTTATNYTTPSFITIPAATIGAAVCGWDLQVFVIPLPSSSGLVTTAIETETENSRKIEELYSRYSNFHPIQQEEKEFFVVKKVN